METVAYNVFRRHYYMKYLILIAFLAIIGCHTPQEKIAIDQRITSADAVAEDPTVPEVTKTKIYRTVAIQNGIDAVKAGTERDSCKAELESNQWKIDFVNYVIGFLVLVFIAVLAYVGLKIYFRFFKPLP
jgi:hypothetical protein